MRDLDFSCGGLLPLIASLEPAPAARDDRRDVWLTRDEVRTSSLALAEAVASERKQLVFLFCGNSCETLIGLLAAAAAGHAVALIDPSLAGDKLSALIAAYQPDLVLSTRTSAKNWVSRRSPGAGGAPVSCARALSNGPRGTPARRWSTSIRPCNCFFPPQGRQAVRNMCGCRARPLSPTRNRSPRRWPSTTAASASPICRCTIRMGSLSSHRIWRREPEFTS